MPKTMVEEFTSTPEGMAQFQQERVILDVAIMIRKLLKEQGLTKADLATRLGKTKSFVTQLLDGRANMTLRTASDVLCALNRALTVSSAPLDIHIGRTETYKLVKPEKRLQSRRPLRAKRNSQRSP